MILLVTSSNRRTECGNVLEQAIGESVEVCETVRRAASLLRNNEYSAVILDDPMVEVEAEALESLLNNIGSGRSGLCQPGREQRRARRLGAPAGTAAASRIADHCGSSRRIAAAQRNARCRDRYSAFHAISDAITGHAHRRDGKTDLGVPACQQYSLAVGKRKLAQRQPPVFPCVFICVPSWRAQPVKRFQSCAPLFACEFSSAAANFTRTAPFLAVGRNRQGRRQCALDDLCNSACALVAGLGLPRCRVSDPPDSGGRPGGSSGEPVNRTAPCVGVLCERSPRIWCAGQRRGIPSRWRCL